MASERLKDLFTEAVALPPEERDRFIASHRTTEPAIAAELESLLTAHQAAGSFLAQPAHLALATPPDLLQGSIGPYRILGFIGKGGMGEVYEAVRDASPGDGSVALKVIRLGMLSTELLRRFRLERRALSRLDHPSIARLLDGGTTEGGLPYLAMEFVRGERIDRYCDQHRLTVQERLRLFLAICDAVQYAHGRLIVHRDLKPGNILVTADGKPKLLDFGIAKLLSAEYETPGTGETRTGAVIFTPDYASPEQAAGKEITAASDVYSLGVLLYVLVTGHLPHEPPASDPRAMLATIQSREPARPSSREIHIETREGTRRVRKHLRGDLDTVILTALDNDLSRRYFSVEQFAGDLRRVLGNVPILARRAPLAHRAGKFIRRNRIGLGIATTVLLAMIAGFTITVHQMRVARAEKARMETINAFLQQILTYSNPMQQTGGPTRTVAVMQDVLDDAAARLESDEFTRQPEVRVQLERILGEAFGRQGRYDLMYAHFLRYIQLCEQQGGLDEAAGLDTLGLWAIMAFSRGELSQSEALFRRTLPKMRTAAAEGRLKKEVFGNALNNYGYLCRTKGDSREAEAAFREVLALSPTFSSNARFVIPVTRATLATVLSDQGRFQDALHTAEEAVAECRRQGITSTPDFGFVMTVYGGFLTEAGRYAEADSTLKEAERILRRMLAPASLWNGDNVRNQAALLYRQGDWNRALAKAEEATSIYRESFGAHYDTYPTALTIQGLSLSKLGRQAEADTVLREAVRLREELLPPGHFFTALAQSAMAQFLTEQGRFREAEPLAISSYRDLLRSQGSNNPRTNLARDRVVELYRAWGKPHEEHEWMVSP